MHAALGISKAVITFSLDNTVILILQRKVYNLLAGYSCAFRNNMEYQQTQMLKNTQVSGLLPELLHIAEHGLIFI